VKSGNFSQLIYVGDVDSYFWKSPNGKALSNSATPAPVPEPGTLILLATGLIGTATAYRKKFSKK
ncbi:MAG: PEP-CTERM sorting domain-containing protein, partial [Desulfosarcina sp.]